MSTIHRTATTVYWTVDSPIGELLLAGDGERLERLHMQAGKRPAAIGADWERGGAVLRPLRAAGRVLRRRATRVRPRARPARDRVRAAGLGRAAQIPYGVTEAYGELAERIGHPGRARAVGAANGANPIAVVIPCHRVIGADGKLTGYTGGLERKRLLLELESPPGGGGHERSRPPAPLSRLIPSSVSIRRPRDLHADRR